MDADVAYDQKFRAKAREHRGWGLAVLVAAAGLWIWAGALLVIPVESPYTECEAPGLADRQYTGELCHSGAALGLPVLLIALALPLAVLGAALYTAAATRLRMAEHQAAKQGLARSQRLEDERRGRAGRTGEDA
ncbi:hypothetical protein [Streptomyces indicus]|uniref:Uncharacterized protein n=1 Tax=Streptomyces indicus TaxID=417292 RepID=A0A1G8UYX6_9ACTN|nr:hypothetical protein [Streptomyces indicus]SDJ59028.1 hypothetical protein SAMN05421806_1011150 [Streptomyces indicus]